MMVDNLKALQKQIPHHVKLVAVSKTKPVEDIQEFYAAGHRIFGENKVQELVEKYAALPHDIEWHLIGHLQTNKVKYIAPFIQLIHSVDSLKLLKEINKEAAKNKRIIDCLLEFYIASEETKFGLSLEEARAILSSDEMNDFKNIRIVGVMGMASFTDNTELIHKEFEQLRTIFKQLKQDFFGDKIWFNELSMGMSNDYKIAIEHGATMVRIGSILFGKR